MSSPWIRTKATQMVVGHDVKVATVTGYTRRFVAWSERDRIYATVESLAVYQVPNSASEWMWTVSSTEGAKYGRAPSEQGARAKAKKVIAALTEARRGRYAAEQPAAE